MEVVFRGERTYMIDRYLSGDLRRELGGMLGVLNLEAWGAAGGPYLRACLPALWTRMAPAGKWMDRPPHRRAGSFDDFLSDLPVWDRLTPVLLGSMNPSDRLDVHLTHLDLLEAALALEAHRRAEGAYPAALSGLAEAVPPDRFTGGALRYRRTEAGFALYSVGKNLVDENGRRDSRRREEFDIPWEAEPAFPWEPPPPSSAP
jgi:hypothetical protein